MARKKVLFLITKSYFGGAQRYVYELAVALKQQNYDVTVACGGQGELVERLHSAGILTYEIKGAERDINVLKEFQALRSITKIIRQCQPDIIHLNSSKVGVLGSLLARILRVPQIVFSAHGWPFLEPRTLPWRTMAWLGSYLTAILVHKVILVSQYDLEHMKMPGIRPKCTVIYNSIAKFPLLPRGEARQTLLSKDIITDHQHNIWLITHGEINHNKNHTTAIDAIAEFNSTHTTKIFYVIIGSGDLVDSLKEQAELKGLKEYVHFLGYVKEAKQYLLAFDIYLMPSLKEGLPYALLEAGLAGLPCIASRVGGIPEIVTDKATGLLIDPQNHMTIVEALDYLLTNADKRSAYSEALTWHLKTNFTLPTMLQKTTAVYALTSK